MTEYFKVCLLRISSMSTIFHQFFHILPNVSRVSYPISSQICDLLFLTSVCVVYIQPLSTFSAVHLHI